MNENPTSPPSREEARASLADVDQVLAQTRRTIAEGIVGPVLILWGFLWMAIYILTTIWPSQSNWLWIPCDVIGFGGMWLLGMRQRAPIKSRPDWRPWIFWMLLFSYAFMWAHLLVPHLPPAYSALVDRKITAYAATIPMFGFTMFGLWTGRFFVGLGLLVTVLTLLGYRYSGDYFNLWMSITGGGSLIASGVFIRKFWK